jgi:hypothetical protein
MNKLTTDQIMALQDSGIRNLYVRWSRGPKYDTKPSRDYSNGGAHAGLSAVWIDYWERDYMVRRLKEYQFLRLKDLLIDAYIYQAEEIGKDSDGYSSIPVGSKCLGKWIEE